MTRAKSRSCADFSSVEVVVDIGAKDEVVFEACGRDVVEQDGDIVELIIASDDIGVVVTRRVGVVVTAEIILMVKVVSAGVDTGFDVSINNDVDTVNDGAVVG